MIHENIQLVGYRENTTPAQPPARQTTPQARPIKAADGRDIVVIDAKTGLRIFIRYPEQPGAAYYHKFEHKRKQHWITLSPDPRESFRKLQIERAKILAGIKTEKQPAAPRTTSLSEILNRYEQNACAAVSIEEPTVRGNINAVRSIFRHVLGEGLTKEQVETRFSDDNLGKKPAAEFNADLLERFKAVMLKRAGTDKLKQDTAAISANALIRQARSLFSKKLPKNFYRDLTLPDINELRDVHLMKEPAKAFKMPDPTILTNIRDKAKLLKETDKNSYIIYLLSLGCGLRPGEIKHARKHWIEIRADGSHVIHVQNENDFRIKDNEERTIRIEEITLQELRSVLPPDSDNGGNDYMLYGSKSERTDQAFRRYKQFTVSCGLLGRRKGAHEMRKIFGSLVTQQAGLRAAQETLGHSTYATTEKYYAGQVELPTYKIFAA